MKVFLTTNIKLAAALTSVGFRLVPEQSDVIRDTDGGTRYVFAVEPETSAGAAEKFSQIFNGGISERVDEIIAQKGLTPEEAALIMFDGARAALNNRGEILTAAKRTKPLRYMAVGGGRTLIYREGADKNQLKELVKRA